MKMFYNAYIMWDIIYFLITNPMIANLNFKLTNLQTLILNIFQLNL